MDDVEIKLRCLEMAKDKPNVIWAAKDYFLQATGCEWHETSPRPLSAAAREALKAEFGDTH